jgi:hypothetical protein
MKRYYMQKQAKPKEYIDPDKTFIYKLNKEMQLKYDMPFIFFNEKIFISTFERMLKPHLPQKEVILFDKL